MNFGIMPGSSEVGAHEIGNIVILGRGRTPDGMDISPIAAARVVTAAQFYYEYDLDKKSGLIVCSGRWSPGDNAGNPKFPNGLTEASCMRMRLLECGINPSEVRVDETSIDTVTNLTETGVILAKEETERPLGIIAQEQQLERALKIAKKVVRGDYVGIIAPEVPDGLDHDGMAARLASKYVTHNLNPGTPNLATIAMNRATNIWKLVNAVTGLAARVVDTGDYPFTK